MPLHPLAGATRSWAFLRSVSKPYGPDLRLAVLAGDEATVARVAGRMRLGAGWVSTLLQTAGRRAVAGPGGRGGGRGRAATATSGGAPRCARRCRRRGVPATGRTGINVWVPVADETRAVTALRDAGYAVAPGSLYRPAPPAAGHPAARPVSPPSATAHVAPLVRRRVARGGRR